MHVHCTIHFFTLFYTILLPFFVYGVVKSVEKKVHLITLFYTKLHLLYTKLHFFTAIFSKSSFILLFSHQFSKGRTRDLPFVKMSLNYTF